MRRRERKWSQDDLAGHCGISGTCVGNIETATTLVELPTLFLIAAALDVPVATLLANLDAMIEPSPEYSDAEDHEDDEPV